MKPFGASRRWGSAQGGKIANDSFMAMAAVSNLGGGNRGIQRNMSVAGAGVGKGPSMARKQSMKEVSRRLPAIADLCQEYEAKKKAEEERLQREVQAIIAREEELKRQQEQGDVIKETEARLESEQFGFGEFAFR